MQPGDPAPVARHNPSGSSSFLLLGDHAGACVPAALGDLGVSPVDRGRHIALDIGVAQLGRALAARLDAVFIHQRYSRLVIDCNRAPVSADAVPESSDGVRIAGNCGLDATARQERVDEIHAPYQSAIAQELEDRRQSGRRVILVSLHSFTPHMNGVDRPWQVGVLHGGGDSAYARRLLSRLAAMPDLVVGDNAPYRMDETDHTVPRHAFADRTPYAELEVRQDLIAEPGGAEAWAAILHQALTEAV